MSETLEDPNSRLVRAIAEAPDDAYPEQTEGVDELVTDYQRRYGLTG